MSEFLPARPNCSTSSWNGKLRPKRLTMTPLVIGATLHVQDSLQAGRSRFFTEICSRVYRFAPFRMTKAQRESIHSYDEHLGVDAFVDGVRWYQRLIERIPA